MTTTTESQSQLNKKSKIIVKAPTQDRSRQTVSQILDACSKLLIEEGFYSITTDKIAKEAGVSIGSLYQFFGNKESVVQAVVKNLIEEDKRILAERAPMLQGLSPEEKIKAILRIGFEVKRNKADLRAKLTTVQYYVTDASYISESITFMQKIVKEYLAETLQPDPERKSYLLCASFLGLISIITLDNPEKLNDPELLNEITQNFVKYLRN